MSEREKGRRRESRRATKRGCEDSLRARSAEMHFNAPRFPVPTLRVRRAHIIRPFVFRNCSARRRPLPKSATRIRRGVEKRNACARLYTIIASYSRERQWCRRIFISRRRIRDDNRVSQRRPRASGRSSAKRTVGGWQRRSIIFELSFPYITDTLTRWRTLTLGFISRRRFVTDYARSDGVSR